MKTINISHNWEDIRYRLKWNFRHLTDNDLCYVKGREEELISRLQHRLGNKKEEVIEILSRLA